jgi:hypothetical protein
MSGLATRPFMPNEEMSSGEGQRKEVYDCTGSHGKRQSKRSASSAVVGAQT